MKCIILSGGLGTRLQSVLTNLPKSMADINGRPFLEYLFDYFITQHYTDCILAVGYKHEFIQNHFENKYKNLNIQYSIESYPLGTGGAIRAALKYASSDPVLVLNGDTLFNVNLSKLVSFHAANAADLSIALKPMKNSDRYGTVNMDSNGKISGFEEKKLNSSGMINGGVYVINPDIFDGLNLPEKFSFEKNFLEKFYLLKIFFGMPFDEYFIDIGVPEDYEKAKCDFQQRMKINTLPSPSS